MENIFGVLLIVVVILAVFRFIWKAAVWKGRTDKFMLDLKQPIEEIRQHTKQIVRRLPDSPVFGESWIKLTEKGEKISERLGGRTWALEIAPTLADQISGESPYDIQDFSFDYVTRKSFDKNLKLLREIRQCAFDHGLMEHEVRNVMRVELRDALLKLNGA